MTWKPTASIDTLKKRAEILRKIRQFFESRNVLEVETPLMSYTTVTDAYLHSFKAISQDGLAKLYLQTSPEYAMKRLLAASSGPIFQIGKAFRDDESGSYHHREFTLLEWYQPNKTYHALIDEVIELLQEILHVLPAKKMTYREAFLTYAQVDPFLTPIHQLQKTLRVSQPDPISGIDYNDRDILQQLIMTEQVEPQLNSEHPVVIYDYPATQAALARIREEKEGYKVAERFEVYVQGLELANGFNELTDEKEQRLRFENDLKKRKAKGLPSMPIDEKLLAALEHGMPACSGVALGIDRFIMLATHSKHIQEVISFAAD